MNFLKTGKLQLGKNLSALIVFGVLKKLVWVLIFISSTLLAQQENKFIRKGNSNFYENNFKDAEVDYMKALEKSPESPRGQYNLGNALYKQENFEDASKLFGSVAGSDMDDEAKANSFFNLGNSFLKAQKYPEAVESYKNALRLNPEDMDSKYNLAYAQKMMQQEQEKQDQNQDQDKQDEEKEEEKDQEQEQDQQQDQQQDEKQDQQQDQQQDQKQQNQQQQPQQISKQDAERMLEALKNDENKTLEKVKLQQVPAKSKSSEKDW